MKSIALVGGLILISALAGDGASAAPGAHGPNGEHLDAPGSATPAGGLARLPDGSVNVPIVAQRRMGVRTQIIAESDAAATIELPGVVIMDPNAGGRVQAAYGGRVRPGPNGFPVYGQIVKEREVLAYVEQFGEPYDAVNQRALLAEIRSSRSLAERDLKRAEALRGTVSERQLDEARERLQSLTAREKAIEQGLGTIEELRAPAAGVIARADAVTGQVVDARDILFEIVDPARLRVEATTGDPSLIGAIEGAHLDRVTGAELRLLGMAASLRDGVLPIVFSVEPVTAGETPALAVGQPVTVVVRLKQRIRGFAVPAAAVVRNPANEPIVWIKSGAERYIPQPVRYQALDARTVVITYGLGADNRVVVEGASLIAQIR